MVAPNESGILRSNLLRFLLLYSALYAAFGLLSPFFPVFLSSRSLSPEQIGFFLAAGTVIRLVSVPVVGRIADLIHTRRLALALCSVGSAIVVLAFIPVNGFAALFVVSLFHAAFVAPTTTLADALALRNASPDGTSPPRFEYGWVRGAGSAAFIFGSVAAGQTLNVFPPAAALVGQAACLIIASAAALLVPEIMAPQRTASRSGRAMSLTALFLNKPFRRLVLVAALLLGSHAMHDSFAMIAWTERGITPGAAGMLWSGSVAAEVVVFFWAGPWILRRTTPLIAMTFSALAAVLRWIVLAQTSSLLALALVEPLHGLTFALFHLACMRILTRITPVELAASAQAIYAFGTTVTSALFTFASGYLYARLGLTGFLVMAALAATSLPSIWALAHALQERPRPL